MSIRMDDSDGSLSRAMAELDAREAEAWARMTRFRRFLNHLGAAVVAALVIAWFYAMFLFVSAL